MLGSTSSRNDNSNPINIDERITSIELQDRELSIEPSDVDDRNGLIVNTTSNNNDDIDINTTQQFKGKANMSDDSKKDKKPKTYPSSMNKIVHKTFPPLFPLDKDLPTITQNSFLMALREETGVTDPDALHKNCYDTVNTLKESYILDKYVLNDDEVAVLCAIPMLLDEGFPIQGMIESCENKAPSELMMVILTALRKLPRYRGVIHFESKEENEVQKRLVGDIIHLSFCVGSKEIIDRENEETDPEPNREIFKIEEGWGYDISDFAPLKDEYWLYDLLQMKKDIVLIEPWRSFSVVNSGIRKSGNKAIIVPLKMIESELIYEKEIEPSISFHAISAMRKGIEDKEVVKKMLIILSSYEFDIGNDSKSNFRINGGIERLLNCYNKHTTLAKEVVLCLANTVEEDEISLLMLLGKGFVKTVTDVTLENIEDREFCQKSSFLVHLVLSVLSNSYRIEDFFPQIKQFELICALIFAHSSDEMICLYTLETMCIIIFHLSTMNFTKETLRPLFESGMFDVISSITRETKNTSIKCLYFGILKEIMNKGLYKVAEHEFVPLFLHAAELLANNGLITHEDDETRKQELSKVLKNTNEANISYNDVINALREIGIDEPENRMKKCFEHIEGKMDEIGNKYLHNKEEATLIATYTYEINDTSSNSPYKIINRMLWGKDENKTKMQLNNKKSYLRLLLMALRKLPRTKHQNLYRGKKNDEHTYSVGEELLWKGLSSTSTSMKVTQAFLTDIKTGKIDGTLFDIRGMWGYNISDFSVFSNEKEILLEPRLKFRVKSVTKKEELVVVVVEPIEQPLYLSDEIPPGCIQHIIKNLANNEESKDICDKMCNILCNIDMDNDTYPDNRNNFSEYGGVDLLCGLFKKHQELNTAKAFVHVIDPRDSNDQIKQTFYEFLKARKFSCALN